MLGRPLAPRIAPLRPEERSGSTQELLDKAERLSPGATDGGDKSNILPTLVRAEDLTGRWLPFGAQLSNGKLPVRDRELLILRTSWNCQAEYEWAHHVGRGRAAGLTQDQIDRVVDGPDAADDDWDALLLRAADELHTDWCLSDATWAGLAERYDTQQLIEVPMLVGNYHMLAMTLNSLGVSIEDGLPRFPAR